MRHDTTPGEEDRRRFMQIPFRRAPKAIGPPSPATRVSVRSPRGNRPDPHRRGRPCDRGRPGGGDSSRTPGPRREPRGDSRSGGRPPRNSPSIRRGSFEAPSRLFAGRPCRECPEEGPDRAAETRSTPSPCEANGRIRDPPRNTPPCQTGTGGHRSGPSGNRPDRWHGGPAWFRRREPTRGRSAQRRSGSAPSPPRTDALRTTCRGALPLSSRPFPPWRRSCPQP